MIRRGEIYHVDLDPVRGREQGGRRPVLVVSADAVNARPLVVTVIPGTDGGNRFRDFPSTVRVPAPASGLPRETVFLAFQARSLDPARFPTKPWGRLGPEWMERVDDALRRALGLAGTRDDVP